MTLPFNASAPCKILSYSVLCWCVLFIPSHLSLYISSDPIIDQGQTCLYSSYISRLWRMMPSEAMFWPTLKVKYSWHFQRKILCPTILANRFTSSMQRAGMENCSGLLHKRVKLRNTCQKLESNHKSKLDLLCDWIWVLNFKWNSISRIKCEMKTPHETWASERWGCRKSQEHCLFSPGFLILFTSSLTVIWHINKPEAHGCESPPQKSARTQGPRWTRSLGAESELSCSPGQGECWCSDQI